MLRRKKAGYIPWILIGILCAFGGVLIGWLTRPHFLPNVPPPMWRGIVPGESTRGDVEATLGPPHRATRCTDEWTGSGVIGDVRHMWTCVFHPLRYEYEDLPPDPRILAKTHRIYFRAGTVWKIVEDVDGYPGEEPIPISHYIDRYGMPEKVVWSHHHGFFRSGLYCRQGMMVHAGHTRVGLVTYFLPMTTDSCIRAMSNEVTREPLSPFFDPDAFDDPWDLSDDER